MPFHHRSSEPITRKQSKETQSQFTGRKSKKLHLYLYVFRMQFVVQYATKTGISGPHHLQWTNNNSTHPADDKNFVWARTRQEAQLLSCCCSWWWCCSWWCLLLNSPGLFSFVCLLVWLHVVLSNFSITLMHQLFHHFDASKHDGWIALFCHSGDWCQWLTGWRETYRPETCHTVLYWKLCCEG